MSRKNKQKQTLKHRLWFLLALILGIALITFFSQSQVISWLQNNTQGIIFILAIIVIGTVWFKYRQYQKRKLLSSDIGVYLKRALSAMDSTARWYTDENEANRELVTSLKLQGFNDAIYQYRLNNGRTADAKIGNMLIEGKLSPTIDEVDRLLGQLTDYTRYSYLTTIVIYGALSSKARERIIHEIKSRYLGKVFLSYLNQPTRLRKSYI